MKSLSSGFHRASHFSSLSPGSAGTWRELFSTACQSRNSLRSTRTRSTRTVSSTSPRVCFASSRSRARVAVGHSQSRAPDGSSRQTAIHLAEHPCVGLLECRPGQCGVVDEHHVVRQHLVRIPSLDRVHRQHFGARVRHDAQATADMLPGTARAPTGGGDDARSAQAVEHALEPAPFMESPVVP